jgi:hypothetical protein
MVAPKCKQCRMEAPYHKMDCSYRPSLPKWLHPKAKTWDGSVPNDDYGPWGGTEEVPK